MLNPEDLLYEIAGTIADELLAGHDRLHVCLFDNKVTARPGNHTKKKHPVVCRISERDARCGLSSSKWDELRDRAWALHKTIKGGG